MRILGLSGSLQQQSANAALLNAASELAPAGVHVILHDSLASLPHFNPDLEADGRQAPPAVLALRAAVAAADALLIASPEYAHSMPGALKNALDWLVGSGETLGKPTALLSASTASTGGIRAQLALTQVLGAMSTPVVEAIGVPFVRSKLDASGALQDLATRERIAGAVRAVVVAASRAAP